MSERADLLLHPVRLRILHALGGANRLTAQQIGAILQDLPPATLYRQLHRLEEGGLVRVVETHAVRGTVEKVYQSTDATLLRAGERDSTSNADHFRHFTVFVGMLLERFRRMLGRRPEGSRRRFGYWFVSAYLTDEEYAALQANMLQLAQVAEANAATAGRTRRLVAVVAFPDDSDEGRPVREHVDE